MSKFNNVETGSIEDIKKNNPNAKILTMEDMEEEEKVADIYKLSDKIIEIVEYINSDEMIDLYKFNKPKLTTILTDKYPDFVHNYRHLLNILVSGENIDRLLKLLTNLDSVNNKKITLDELIPNYSDEIAKKHLYPNMSETEYKKMMDKVRSEQK